MWLYNICYVGRSKLDESIVFWCTIATIAGEAEARDVAELGEVGVHLAFVKAVRDVSMF
jgi:hypothetical protein